MPPNRPFPAGNNGWPAPTPAERTRNAALRDIIARAIDDNAGAIDFARFMELALYTPGMGYYHAEGAKFGLGGDFVTAPGLSPVFARCLARQCRQVLARLDRADILEVGAGDGALACDLLVELERLASLPGRYLILELSAALRARQQASVQMRVPHLYPRMRWIDTLPSAFRGVVVGNELIDAMPVERFRIHHDGIYQLQVAWDDENFRWHERPADTAIIERIAPLDLPVGYNSEIGFTAQAWVRSIAQCLQEGVVLLFDYGFPRREFYHPDRRDGTLMCHYRQRAHGDPLVLVGLQDITAHIDFTAIAETASESGLKLKGFSSQAAFLIDSGLSEIIMDADRRDARAYLALTASVKKLTDPSEMGELYKVIALGRGIDEPLLGFHTQNRVSRL